MTIRDEIGAAETLPERLRKTYGRDVPEGDGWSWDWETDRLASDAAHRIESLEGAVERLEAALRRREDRVGAPTPPHALDLLGRQVVVTLDHDDDRAIARGRLACFDTGGEIVIEDGMGFFHWCWPALEIRALD